MWLWALQVGFDYSEHLIALLCCGDSASCTAEEVLPPEDCHSSNACSSLAVIEQAALHLSSS